MKGIVVSGWLAASVCGAVGGCAAHDAQSKGRTHRILEGECGGV